MNVQGYVISMSRAGRRMEQVQRIISECPVACTRFEAIDGGQLSASDIDSVYNTNANQPKYPFVLNRGEIGCFLSHRSVWEKIAESDAPGALVMEDDIELLAGFSAALAFAIEAAPTCSYIQFQTREFNGNHHVVEKRRDLQLLRPQLVPLRATAQWITRHAAAKLLETTKLIDRPIDTFIQMRWLHRVDVLVLTPSCVREVSRSLGGSVINERKDKTSIWPQLTREWSRFAYRKKIELQSRYAA